jgi:hypothetical protein
MRPVLSMLLVTFAFVGTPAAQTIGVYGDPSAATCPVIPIGPTQVYVVATLAPAACGGITGAEFRLVGWPTSWFYSLQQGPGIPEIGNPFQEGIRLTSFTCRTGEGGTVPLLTITVFAPSPASNVTVTVNGHLQPADPQFACPVVALCDAPVFTKLCATGITTRINDQFGFCRCLAPCLGACQPIGVEPSSWSSIKRLYD